MTTKREQIRYMIDCITRENNLINSKLADNSWEGKFVVVTNDFRMQVIENGKGMSVEQISEKATAAFLSESKAESLSHYGWANVHNFIPFMKMEAYDYLKVLRASNNRTIAILNELL